MRFLLLFLFLCSCALPNNSLVAVPGPAGSPGPIGSTGPQGTPGISIVSTATPDLSNTCGNTGTVIMMAQDTEQLGVWSPLDNNQTAILVCNGINGTNGTNGVNSTAISTVQFCPGYTSYPSSFPEFGLCVNSAIFAVYWDGRNAWLAETVPGYYESTSTSAPCNFTVKTNCVISN